MNEQFTDITKLRRVDELRGRITELFTNEQILDMAKNFALPHYVLTNPVTNEETILFNTNEVATWLSHHVIRRNECKITQELKILHFDYEGCLVQKSDAVPPALIFIEKLYKLPTHLISTPPGVYFLCRNNDVVYVGQSINVASRVATHIAEREKRFDTIFFIPCHINNLLTFEMALIRLLKPEYNNERSGLKSMTPVDKKIIEEISYKEAI